MTDFVCRFLKIVFVLSLYSTIAVSADAPAPKAEHPFACRMAMSFFEKYNNLAAKFRNRGYKGRDRDTFNLKVYELLRTKFNMMIDEYLNKVAEKYPKSERHQLILRSRNERPLSGPIPLKPVWQIFFNSDPAVNHISDHERASLLPEVKAYLYKISGLANNSSNPDTPHSNGQFNFPPDLEKLWKEALKSINEKERAGAVENLYLMIRSMNTFDRAKGFYESVIMATPTNWIEIKGHRPELPFFHRIVTPVGEYGSQFAANLVRTTQVLYTMAYETLIEASSVIYKDDPNLIKFQTARGIYSSEEDDVIAPLTAFIEGILSVHQAIVVLTSSKIQGVNSGSEALDIIANSGDTKLGLVSEFTRRIPMGIIGPLASSGRYFLQPVEKSGDSYVLSASLKEAANEYREVDKSLKNPQNPSALGLTCPVAACLPSNQSQAGSDSLTTGIQKMVKLYQEVFHQVEQEGF